MSGKVVPLSRGTRARLGLGPRPRTENVARMPVRDRVRLRVLQEVDPVDIDRPLRRADCEHGERPCPWVSCRYNLYLDVNEDTGSIKYNFPDREPDEMPAGFSCALDVADRGGATFEDLGKLGNVPRERIRQIEAKALEQLRRNTPTGRLLRELADVPKDGALPPARGHAPGSITRQPTGEPRDDNAAEDDAPPTRLSFFAHADIDADGLEAVERADDAACRAVWTTFVKDSNARGFDARSRAQKAAAKRKTGWKQHNALPKREEPPMNGTTTNGAATSLSPRLRATLDAWRELTKNGETPTSAELAEKAKLSSPANAQNALSVLRKQGLVPQGDRRVPKTPAKRPKSKPAAAAPSTPKTKRGLEDYPATVPPAKPPRASSSDPVIAAMIARRDEFRRKADALDIAIEAMAVAL